MSLENSHEALNTGRAYSNDADCHHA